MSHIARTIAGLAIAAAISSPVAAQGVVTQKSISLPMAQTIANAVIAKCQSMGFKISVSVLDRGGLALVMLRDEGASLHTVESSDRKAYTARTFRQPSAAIVKRIQEEPAVAGFKEYTRRDCARRRPSDQGWRRRDRRGRRVGFARQG